MSVQLVDNRPTALYVCVCASHWSNGPLYKVIQIKIPVENWITTQTTKHYEKLWDYLIVDGLWIVVPRATKQFLWVKLSCNSCPTSHLYSEITPFKDLYNCVYQWQIDWQCEHIPPLIVSNIYTCICQTYRLHKSQVQFLHPYSYTQRYSSMHPTVTNTCLHSKKIKT